jgi:hypothetical protein
MMKVKLITIYLLLIETSFSVCAQDIYQLKYKSPDVNDKATYDAFFSLSANGTGIVRVKPDNNNNLIIEMEIEERYAKNKEGMPDITYVVYEGMNPKVVKGDKSIKFSPFTFWFKINTDNFYDPWAVTPVSVNSAPAAGNFLSAEFVNSRDLSQKKDFVSAYFDSTTAYYNNLFGPKSRGGMLSQEERKNTHIYLIVVASTKDPSLQPNCLIDAQKVINTFSDIATKVLGLSSYNLHLDTVFGSNYSRSSVETALKKLRPSKNDLIIFYYSGHGFHNKKINNKIYPFFDLRDPTKTKYYADLQTQTLNVQDIYDTIIKKGARFNLVLSDCCNDTVAAPKKKGLQPPGKKGLSKSNFDNVKALFMSKLQINLLMTAASVDEEAIVTPSFNSYFTYFFLQSLNTYVSPEKNAPTWPEVLAASQSLTIKQVSGLPCKEATKCPKQTPKLLIPGIK